MGALAAIQAGGCEVVYVVQIEGYGNLLTTRYPTEVLQTWQNSALPGCAEVTGCLGGLSVIFDQNTSANPWEPFGQPPICRLAVVQDIDNAGALSDQFAVDVFKRSGGVETSLTSSITPATTTIAALR
jgi:hypothetical protein